MVSTDPIDTLLILTTNVDDSIIQYDIQIREKGSSELVVNSIYDKHVEHVDDPFILIDNLNPSTEYELNISFIKLCDGECEGKTISVGSGFIYDFKTLDEVICTYDTVAGFFSSMAYKDWYFDQNTGSGEIFDWCGTTWITKFAYSNGADHVFVHDSVDQVVISYRGTEGSISDWFDNVNNLYLVKCSNLGCNNPDSKIGVGFRNAFIGTQPSLVNNVLSEIGNKNRIITGHSQGAAIATIATLYFNDGISNPNKFITITFGSPSVGNIYFTEDFGGRRVISHRYVASYTHFLGYYVDDGITLTGPYWSVHVPYKLRLPCPIEYQNGVVCHSMENYMMQVFNYVPPLTFLIDKPKYYVDIYSSNNYSPSTYNFIDSTYEDIYSTYNYIYSTYNYIYSTYNNIYSTYNNIYSPSTYNNIDSPTTYNNIDSSDIYNTYNIIDSTFTLSSTNTQSKDSFSESNTQTSGMNGVLFNNFIVKLIVILIVVFLFY
jgi:hypothetical protein